MNKLQSKSGHHIKQYLGQKARSAEYVNVSLDYDNATVECVECVVLFG